MLSACGTIPAYKPVCALQAGIQGCLGYVSGASLGPRRSLSSNEVVGGGDDNPIYEMSSSNDSIDGLCMSPECFPLLV